MSRITHYEDGGTTYFSANRAILCNVIVTSLRHLVDPFESLAANQLIAENEVTLSGKGPKEFIFTDEHCDLILNGIERRYQEPFISSFEGFVFSLSALKIQKAITEALGKPWISSEL